MVAEIWGRKIGARSDNVQSHCRCWINRGWTSPLLPSYQQAPTEMYNSNSRDLERDLLLTLGTSSCPGWQPSLDVLPHAKLIHRCLILCSHPARCRGLPFRSQICQYHYACGSWVTCARPGSKLVAEQVLKTSSPSFELAAFPPGNPSFNFPPQQMGLHQCRREVSMRTCISSHPSSLPHTSPWRHLLSRWRNTSQCPGESRNEAGLPLAPCSEEKNGIVLGKVQGRSYKFANGFCRAPSPALIHESLSGVAAGFSATPHISLLQGRNKLPWNRLTFGIIISAFLSPKSGAPEWKLRKAKATSAFCQHSLQQEKAVLLLALSKKSVLPWEQTPKQVAITHILTWTSAGGTTSPCRSTKGRGDLITLCLCSECGCPVHGAQRDKALGTDVWFDYSFPFSTNHMVLWAAQISGNQNSWAPSLTPPFAHLIFKVVFMYQQNLLPWTSPPP